MIGKKLAGVVGRDVTDDEVARIGFFLYRLLGVAYGIRRGAAGACGPDTLGGHGDGGGVKRVHGRRRALWREGRPRSAQRLRTDALRIPARSENYGLGLGALLMLLEAGLVS